MTGKILSIVFACLSLAFLLYLIAGGKFPGRKEFKKYIIATSAIYLSGTVLVAALFLVIIDLPLIFAVISETMMLFIFAMSTATIIILGKKMNEIRDENQKNL
ncbi:MAG TPA: hypothetical protein DCW41_04130 [Clostridiales bacterium]|nr:hypothetical protein [Clostridiales bacterium]